MDLGLLLDMVVRDAPDRIALTDADGTATTRLELQHLASRAASTFRDLGATRVGFLATNGRALPISMFGAALAGLPFVPCNYRASDEHLAAIVAGEPGLVLVAGPEHRGRAGRTPARAVIGTEGLLATPAGEVTTSDPVDPDSIAVLLHTSGTTGEPKAAVLRHRHLMSYVLATVEFGAAEADDAVLVSVPPYHVAGVVTILTNLFCGRRIVYLDSFEPGRWLDLVRRERITHAMVVPTMLARIVEHLGDDHADLPTLRSIAYGGAGMPAPVIERALARFPDLDFTNAYGLTETSSTITVLGPDDHRAAVASSDLAVRARLGSAGRPVPGVELVIVDPAGERREPGVVGEIAVRGPQVSGEYLGADPRGAEGWFRTRDVGWLDDDGYLFVEGRADDTIIRGGENVSPAEIEAVLVRHPAVAQCAVVGVADEEWGQRIAAAVVLEPGRSVEVDDLAAWARRRLRGAKTPELIEVRAELPFTETGKLLRREVRASFTRAGRG